MLAEQVVGKRLQRVEGVARSTSAGLATREVRIDLDPARLRAYGVTPAEIATALREANADQPVGLLSDRDTDAILRVEGRVRDPRRFAEMVVGRRGNLPLTLADLGTLVEREREPDSLARINGQRAVSFNVFKQQDANIVDTGDAIKEAMDELRKTLPAGRRAAADLRRQRLREELAAGPAAHADRGRAADDRDRVPVPALLALAR